MSKRELGENYFKEGYNCAQSVALAFLEELSLDKDTALKLVSGFGGGFGRMREVCGAVSGMVFVLNAVKGYFDPSDNVGKVELYKTVQSLMKAFKDKNGSYICAELLGVSKECSPTPETRTATYYKKRPCASLVGDACEILQDYLQTIKKQ